jgi:BolA protein
MNINELIAIVKNKLETKITIQSLKIEDKSFLHKNHKGHQEGKFHLKLIIKSNELAKLSKINSTKRIYSVLDLELKDYIHSIQILLN